MLDGKFRASLQVKHALGIDLGPADVNGTMPSVVVAEVGLLEIEKLRTLAVLVLVVVFLPLVGIGHVCVRPRCFTCLLHESALQRFYVALDLDNIAQLLDRARRELLGDLELRVAGEYRLRLEHVWKATALRADIL